MGAGAFFRPPKDWDSLRQSMVVRRSSFRDALVRLEAGGSETGALVAEAGAAPVRAARLPPHTYTVMYPPPTRRQKIAQDAQI